MTGGKIFLSYFLHFCGVPFFSSDFISFRNKIINSIFKDTLNLKPSNSIPRN